MDTCNKCLEDLDIPVIGNPALDKTSLDEDYFLEEDTFDEDPEDH